MSAKSAGKASKYQYDAQREAMAYQKERDAAERTTKDAARQRWQDAYDAWLERNYGVKRQPRPGESGVKAVGGPAMSPTGTLPATGATLKDIGMGDSYSGPPTTTPVAPGGPIAPGGPMAPEGVPVEGAPRGTLGEMGGWNDWRRYMSGGM
jgi:hypothetical protein